MLCPPSGGLRVAALAAQAFDLRFARWPAWGQIGSEERFDPTIATLG